MKIIVANLIHIHAETTRPKPETFLRQQSLIILFFYPFIRAEVGLCPYYFHPTLTVCFLAVICWLVAHQAAASVAALGRVRLTALYQVLSPGATTLGSLTETVLSFPPSQWPYVVQSRIWRWEFTWSGCEIYAECLSAKCMHGHKHAKRGRAQCEALCPLMTVSQILHFLIEMLPVRLVQWKQWSTSDLHWLFCFFCFVFGEVWWRPDSEREAVEKGYK